MAHTDNSRLDTDRLSPRNISRLFGGLAIQPLVAALLGFVSFPVVDYTNRALRGGVPADALDAAIAFSLGSAIVAGLVTLVGAFPIVAWRLNRGAFALPEVLWWGVILGNAPLAIVAVLTALNGGAPSNSPGAVAALWALVAGSLFGLAGAAVFWAVAVRHEYYPARQRRAD